MLDVIAGILAIIFALVILQMKNSKKKWVAFIGWLILTLSKIFDRI